MHFRVFTLHPDLFSSYLQQALVARAISKNLISIETVNWREQFGQGKHKQVDDRPFGGGGGMVLMVEPIFLALNEVQAVSTLYQPPQSITKHQRILPNNSSFYRLWLEKIHTQPLKKISILLTPRGFPLNQEIVEWLTNFEEINLLAGRYEGFDARVSELVDIEISLGNFVLNGGEIAALAVIESVSRLIPGFVGKEKCTNHDSFSAGVNLYYEEGEYILGKKNLQSNKAKLFWQDSESLVLKPQLFDDQYWLSKLAPQLEHPQYTRPEVWNNWSIPSWLKTGNHKIIHHWRTNWWKPEVVEQLKQYD